MYNILSYIIRTSMSIINEDSSNTNSSKHIRKCTPSVMAFDLADPAFPSYWSITTRYTGIEKVKRCDAIYLHFAKAFDKVDNGILLNKLINIGI